MDFTFRAFAEDAPGSHWQRYFKNHWQAYRRWFLRFGERKRPTYLESIQALKRHMPEFMATYETMVEMAGGGDHAARFLSQYCPPPLFRGCSQSVYIQDEVVLARNYDYSPYIFDGLVMRSKFDQRAVIAMLDCMSGALDGINSDGLAVSMSFGGREEFGEGFGIPILLRYVLEYAGNVNEACELIKRVPVNGAYNVMLLDSDAKFETLAIGPGQAPLALGNKVSTNHQPGGSWPIYEEKVETYPRFDYLSEINAAGQLSGYEFTRRFLQPPLYNNKFGRGFGTLYSAAFYPQRKTCEYFWPNHAWGFDFRRFKPLEYQVTFVDPEGYPAKSRAYADIYTSQPVPVLKF